jgi:pimeloyl-ACP methyl ester carboxylesterase
MVPNKNVGKDPAIPKDASPIFLQGRSVILRVDPSRIIPLQCSIASAHESNSVKEGIKMIIIKIARLLVAILPSALAILVVRALTSSKRPPTTPEQQDALTRATELRYGKGQRNTAWSWGSGPLVIFVHGWNGRAAQLAPLAEHIAELGFHCVAIDITGHGSSPGKKIEWAYFIEDIATLTKTLDQNVHAYVTHSAGGLATMAARQLQGIVANFFVCINVPSHPFPPIDVLRRTLNPKPSVTNRYKKYIASQFHSSWENLQYGSAFVGGGANLLLFYDTSDTFVRHAEGDRIQEWCPGARLVKTDAYGHTKILAAPELFTEVGNFLQRDNS